MRIRCSHRTRAMDVFYECVCVVTARVCVYVLYVCVSVSASHASASVGLSVTWMCGMVWCVMWDGLVCNVGWSGV